MTGRNRQDQDRSERLTRAREVLRAVGLRPTPQRELIAAELMGEHDDVTAQELHTRLRSRGERLGLATVYRTLGLLAGAGAVDTLAHHPGELCYRWCGEEHHHHLVCLECHRVVEVGGCALDDWLDRLSSEHGFLATGHRLEVAGLCAGCRDRGETRSPEVARHRDVPADGRPAFTFAAP